MKLEQVLHTHTQGEMRKNENFQMEIRKYTQHNN